MEDRSYRSGLIVIGIEAGLREWNHGWRPDFVGTR